MDPNLFHLDWGRTLEALLGVIVLAFLLERALAIVFESRWFVHHLIDRRVPSDRDSELGGNANGNASTAAKFPVREFLAFVLAAIVCVRLDFDALAIIFLQPQTSLAGEIITGAVVAGGSKASIALFQDLLNIRSSAVEEKKKLDAERRGEVSP